MQKRVQFIQNSIEEVEIKLSEEKRYIEKNEEVNDPEAAHRYLESLALTVRKLRALLEREKSANPSVTDSSQPNTLKASPNSELVPAESDVAVESRATKEYQKWLL